MMKLFNKILPFLLSMIFTITFLLCLTKFTNGDLNLVLVFVLILIVAGAWISIIMKHKRNVGVGIILGNIIFVAFVIWALTQMD